MFLLRPQFPFDGRKHFFDFEARSSPYQLYSAGIPIKGPDGAPDTIPAASAKSMYKLADKINMKELKVKSLNFLINNLNLVNLPYEVFSNFSMSFAEVKKVEIEMMLAHWVSGPLVRFVPARPLHNSHSSLMHLPSHLSLLITVRDSTRPGDEECLQTHSTGSRQIPSFRGGVGVPHRASGVPDSGY